MSLSEQHLDDAVTRHAHQNFVRLFLGETVGEALQRLQNSRVEGRIIYFYVVDAEDRLQGVIPTRRLLLNPPQTPLADIMVRQVIALPATATLSDACEFFILHRLLALPVVDPQRRILGVLDVELYTEEISDLVRQEENENIFQLVGVRLAEGPRASVAAAFRGRFPWLLCNIAAGLACAAVAAMFRHVLNEVIVLAMFIPVVLSLAESVSIQSLTLALQAHQPGRFSAARCSSASAAKRWRGSRWGWLAAGWSAWRRPSGPPPASPRSSCSASRCPSRRPPCWACRCRLPCGPRGATPRGLRADRPGHDRRGHAHLLSGAGRVDAAVMRRVPSPSGRGLG